MSYLPEIVKLVDQITGVASAENKKSGFFIGNTTKIDEAGLYITPLRNNSLMVTGGVVIYEEKQAVEIAEVIDGRVDYVFVDAEKKISPDLSLDGVLGNIEAEVRACITKSKLWIYKGNDLSVDAADMLLTQITNRSHRGIGGVKVAILGAGNLGSKLALRLVEKGAVVTITRRNQSTLETIVNAINLIKPRYTEAQVIGKLSNKHAARNANILIGATPGIAVIDADIINNLGDQALIIDAGKGTITEDAIELAAERNFRVFRLDITLALESLIYQWLSAEKNFANNLGRKRLHDENIVSGGLIGKVDEIVVDSVWNPRTVYGISDGKGDFVRKLSRSQLMRLEKFNTLIFK